jgi:septal ring factor EnvC (AmiA/AmiB activator)
MHAVICFAQSDLQQKLEEQKQSILNELIKTKSKLNDEKLKEKNVLKYIYEYNHKIDLRKNLIENNARQVVVLEGDINKKRDLVNHLKTELDNLKKDYARTIVKTYKNRSNKSKMMFLFSSDNFLQAFKRTQYLKQYAGYRKIQADEIHHKSEEVSLAIGKLDQQKLKQKEVLTQQEKEKKTLELEKKQHEIEVGKIKKTQSKLAAEINKKNKEAKAIDQQIQKLIRQAIADANRRKAEEERQRIIAANKKTGAKTEVPVAKPVSSETIELTPEGQIISDNFKANRGSLPWPTEKGFVSMRFGNNPHPLEPSVTVNSNGIEITTDRGSTARAVFGGEVIGVQVLSANNKAVSILHGDYITVYYNLESVKVGTGQRVRARDAIGTINYNSILNKSALKFSVLQNNKFLNPISWLSAR